MKPLAELKIDLKLGFGFERYCPWEKIRKPGWQAQSPESGLPDVNVLWLTNSPGNVNTTAQLALQQDALQEQAAELGIRAALALGERSSALKQ